MVRVVLSVFLALVVAPSPGLAYEEVVVKDGGTITGIVRFAGTPPKPETIAVTRDVDVCGDDRPSEALVVGADRGVKDSVVVIKGVARGKRATGDVTIDNNKCTFVGRVTAVGPGDRVRVKNSDPILHHVRGLAGSADVFNLALPTKEQMIDITRRLTTPGVVRVLCDTHRHMAGWLVVHDSPYHAVTDERGAFRIDGVPPGTYAIAMWHEGYRRKGVTKDGRPLYGAPVTVTREVTVAPNGAATIDFELR